MQYLHLICVRVCSTSMTRACLVDEVEEFEFELNEVYSIDIVMSTGEGRQLFISIALSHFFCHSASLRDRNVWILADLDVRAIVCLHFL